MSTTADALSPPPAPNRVYYSLGRMLGVDDFQADQDYHRGRLARTILQVCGTGTVSGLKVVLNQNWTPNTSYPTWAYIVDSNTNVQVNLGTSGTSGTNEITWPAGSGAQILDGNVTWTNEGPIVAAGWTPNTTFSGHTVITDPNGNLQVLTASTPFTTGLEMPAWSSIAGAAVPDGASVNAWTCLGSAVLEIEVTPGVAIDRVGRIIEVPRPVCIGIAAWLASQAAADLNGALKATSAASGAPLVIVVDVFATFVGCTRGVTPCFATQDDYDATDAFSANRLLDSFAMQLVLRPDVDFTLATPALNLPEDPWYGIGAVTTPPSPSPQTLQQQLLDATSGPGASAPFGGMSYPREIPPQSGLDPSAVFLARIRIPATAVTGQAPAANLTAISIDNFSRLFLYPASLVARWIGLTSGAES
ncbi:MAG TPA: hypothetical protein VK755_14205 [Candidatus Acidoferrales bacterium]|jgi:hypothetical protein|nr:hypothetical protein [Candidatus Acidoferrales bacterium]